MHVSMPTALTPSTIATTTSMSRDFGLRQAAPMQYRDAPCALAFLASAMTRSTSISFEALRPVFGCADWLQEPQSSAHPPVLIDSRRLFCTLFGSNEARCTVW